MTDSDRLTISYLHAHHPFLHPLSHCCHQECLREDNGKVKVQALQLEVGIINYHLISYDYLPFLVNSG